LTLHDLASILTIINANIKKGTLRSWSSYVASRGYFKHIGKEIYTLGKKVKYSEDDVNVRRE